MDEQRISQQESADQLGAILAATAGARARAQHRQPSTSVSPEQVDLIGLLHGLAEALPKFCERAFQRQVSDEEWRAKGTILLAAAQGCFAQADQPQVIDQDPQ